MTVKHSNCFYKPEQEVLLLSAQELSRWNRRQPVARTPLSDEQVDYFRGEANRGFDIEREHYFKAFRDAEAAHGIKEQG